MPWTVSSAQTRRRVSAATTACGVGWALTPCTATRATTACGAAGAGTSFHGGVGKDHLYGGKGDDTLYGGWLADRLHGGAGDLVDPDRRCLNVVELVPEVAGRSQPLKRRLCSNRCTRITPAPSQSTVDHTPFRHHRRRRNRRRNARLPPGHRRCVGDDHRTVAPGCGRDRPGLRVDQRHPRQRPRPRPSPQPGHRGLPSPGAGTRRCARDRLERSPHLDRESGRVGATGRRAHRLGL